MSNKTATHRESVMLSRKFRRIIVKIGSGALTDAGAGLRVPIIRALAAQVAKAWEERGIQFVVVTSGAVAAGQKKMGMREKPRTVSMKQATAAVGQTSLMYVYERAFEKRGRKVGQLLLTHEDFENRERYNNARNTVEALLSRGIVPIINENDTVATEEIRLGDNDHLAALVTQMIGADLLILLTDNEGVFTRDPHRFADARLIPVIGAIDEELLRVASTLRTQAMGTGGMASKLLAARIVSESGTPVVIGSGFKRRSIDHILAGKEVGTLVLPADRGRRTSRKMWIAYARQPHGTIVVDDGAVRVLREGGKSLLPAGVVSVQGRFRRGDAVSISDLKGQEFARGITAWSSKQVERGRGKKSHEVRSLLGEGTPAEVVHRDDLMIITPHKTPGGRKGAVS
ncbi:MAG: glutamate 5-kinase [Deltaproteobacteria bacterium]|nr:glutamate 5-kinase [Deltaproteobacteria bacterium]